MRTGADHRESLRDERKVWVMGEGWATDVTAHTANISKTAGRDAAR